MSSNTGAVLDAPDVELQQIQMKLFRGQPLTKQEQTRWANRLSVERETLRTGGTMKASVMPQPTGGQPASAYEAGRRETQEAADYIRGRDEVLGRGAPGAQPKQKEARRSQIQDDMPPEVKQADNMLGPHLGADGLPAMWNVPKRIAGRYNGGNLDEGANLPPGTIALGGRDGNWRAWNGEKFGDEQFASLADVGARKPIGSAPAKDWTAGASTLPRENAPRSLEDDRAYIRQAGYGDFLDRLEPAPAAQPNTPGPSPDRNFLAAAWNGQAGMMPRPGAGVPTVPTITPQPDTPPVFASGVAPSMPFMAPSAGVPARPASALPSAAAVAAAPSGGIPGMDIFRENAMQVPSPVRPAPVAPAPAARGPMVSFPYGNLPPMASAETPAVEKWWNDTTQNAIWRPGSFAPAAQRRPSAAVQAATTYDPFSPPERKRRSVGVLPE